MHEQEIKYSSIRRFIIVYFDIKISASWIVYFTEKHWSGIQEAYAYQESTSHAASESAEDVFYRWASKRRYWTVRSLHTRILMTYLSKNTLIHQNFATYAISAM